MCINTGYFLYINYCIILIYLIIVTSTDLFVFFFLEIFLERIGNNYSLNRHLLFTYIGAQTEFLVKW